MCVCVCAFFGSGKKKSRKNHNLYDSGGVYAQIARLTTSAFRLFRDFEIILFKTLVFLIVFDQGCMKFWKYKYILVCKDEICVCFLT